MAVECNFNFVVLSVIHKAGWVHRDISPGNLYLYIDPSTGEKRGLVGDLEFAKRVGSTGKRDGRTVRFIHVSQEKCSVSIVSDRVHRTSWLLKL